MHGYSFIFVKSCTDIYVCDILCFVRCILYAQTFMSVTKYGIFCHIQMTFVSMTYSITFDKIFIHESLCLCLMIFSVINGHLCL